jgi:guanylate kinase
VKTEHLPSLKTCAAFRGNKESSMTEIRLEGETDSPDLQPGIRPRGLLFVLSGPSGVGKDKLIERLFTCALNLRLVVTATTRAPRPGEVDGIAYHFLDRSTFDSRKARGEFVEWAEYVGNCYGTPISSLRLAMQDDHDAVLKIDVQGAAQVKRRLPDAVLVFLAPPSMLDLENRLRKRADTDSTELARRIARAEEEMQQLPEYDYSIVNHNDRIDDAVEQFSAIITAERCRVRRRTVTL